MGQFNVHGAVYASAGNQYFGNIRVATAGGVITLGSVQIAVRVATRRVWVRRDGNAWQGGGDPAADTNPSFTLSGTGAIYAVATLTKAGWTPSRYVEIHPDAASTTGVVPSGFTAANWA
jgi:hypothetical protein